MTGYVKEYRSIMQWEWYTDYKTAHLFRHCILKANYEPKKWRGIDIRVGQFVTSLAHLAKETGLSVSQVRTCLEKLKSTNELTNETSSQYSIITVNNWEKFQANDKQVDKRMTNERQTNDKRMTTTKERKEDKESKEKKNRDVVCNIDFEKCFKLYAENCTNLIPLSFERRSKATLEGLRDFLNEIDFDFSYFLNLCKRANSLERIVKTKIDFRSMLKNHIGIMNGKYEKETADVSDVIEAWVKKGT